MKTRMNAMGLRPEACYYAYLFPFTVAENYPSEDQERIFLPYLAKRIEWMRPRVVVGLGKSVCKYLAAEFVQAKIPDSRFNFDKFLEDTIPSQQNKNKKKKTKLMRFANPKDAVMMGSPHPFSLLQNQRTAAASPSNPQKECADWENLLAALKDFLFPHRISGPKVYDTRDGKYKIDPLHAVKKAAEMEYEERRKRKREEEEEKRKKNEVAVGTRDPNDNSVPQNGKTEGGREEIEKRIKLSKNQSNLDRYFSLERGIGKKGEEEEEEEVTMK